MSLLDSVVGEVSSLQKKLPPIDRTRLDQYLGDRSYEKLSYTA